MSVASNNRIYKVTSLFIKIAILILSFWYIGHELNKAIASLDSDAMLQKPDFKLLSLVFMLMFINWGLEALKWMILIRPLETISFFASLKAVFSGVTVSIFMPNRVGEFAGRIFFLNKADKVEATLRNFTGSFAQFFMTIAVGLVCFFIASRNGNLPSFVIEVFNIWYVKLFILLAVVFLAGLLILNRYRANFSEKIQSWYRALFDTGKKDLMNVLLLSALRYFVFLFQYYLVLLAFGIHVNFDVAFSLIAITFLITSVVPSFALTEIATRGAAAIYLFAAHTENSAAIVAASFVVWIINLAFPAFIGSAFIWKFKFFRS